MMNKPRCRPGDLAVVISANLQPNLGRIVKVIELDEGKNDLRYPPDQLAWLVQSDQPMTWLANNKRVHRKRGPVPDSQLQPIRGYRPKQDIDDVRIDLAVPTPERKTSKIS